MMEQPLIIMFFKPTLLTWVAFGTIGAIALGHSATHAQNATFVCTVTNDQVPTTLVQTPNGPVEVFKWQSNYFRPPYTPMQRCQEVSERMNVFKSQGMMDYLTSGRVNNQPVVCAGTRCASNGSNILLTLRRDQSPNQVLQEIEANRAGAAGPSRQLSGGSTSRSSGLLQSNSDGTMTLNLKRFIGGSATANSPATPTQPTQSPIFRNNSAPAVPPQGSTPRW